MNLKFLKLNKFIGGSRPNPPSTRVIRCFSVWSTRAIGVGASALCLLVFVREPLMALGLRRNKRPARRRASLRLGTMRLWQRSKCH
jgi:hypothetical protein